MGRKQASKYRQKAEKRFSKLMEEHMDFACHIAQRFVQEEASVQDIVQNAFIKAWKAFHSFKEEQALFSTWLYSIVKNESIDYIRISKKLEVQDLSNVETIAEGQSDHADPYDLIQKVILLADQLPNTQKEIFVLRDLEGYSIREVMKMTKLSEGSIKTNLYLARKTLRNWLNKEEDYE